MLKTGRGRRVAIHRNGFRALKLARRASVGLVIPAFRVSTLHIGNNGRFIIVRRCIRSAAAAFEVADVRKRVARRVRRNARGMRVVRDRGMLEQSCHPARARLLFFYYCYYYYYYKRPEGNAFPRVSAFPREIRG